MSKEKDSLVNILQWFQWNDRQKALLTRQDLYVFWLTLLCQVVVSDTKYKSSQY